MANYPNTKIIFVSPYRLRIGDDIKRFLKRHQITHFKENNLKEVIPLADVIYMTRIQGEWDGENSLMPKSVKLKYVFKKEHLDLMKEGAVLMHPLPKRKEIDEEVGYSNDPRVIFWRQVRNGMWIRVALIAVIFQKEEEILNYRL